MYTSEELHFFQNVISEKLIQIWFYILDNIWGGGGSELVVANKHLDTPLGGL